MRMVLHYSWLDDRQTADPCPEQSRCVAAYRLDGLVGSFSALSPGHAGGAGGEISCTISTSD